MTAIDLRCPASPRRQFAKILDDGTVEIACSDCKRMMRDMGAGNVLVIHRYNRQGFIDTLTTLLDPPEHRSTR